MTTHPSLLRFFLDSGSKGRDGGARGAKAPSPPPPMFPKKYFKNTSLQPHPPPPPLSTQTSGFQPWYGMLLGKTLFCHSAGSKQYSNSLHPTCTWPVHSLFQDSFNPCGQWQNKVSYPQPQHNVTISHKGSNPYNYRLKTTTIQIYHNHT